MLLSPSSRRGRIFLAAPVAVVALLALPPSSSADGPPAVDQYRESIPNATGSSPNVGSSQRSTPIILPPKIVVAITRRGGKDAHALKKIATSPRYSAPPVRSPGRDVPAAVLRAKAPSALSAAFGASGDRSFLLLVVSLGLATGATLVAAAVRRRRG